MVATMTAGKKPTASELNDIAQVGQMLLDVTATTDSSTWNSSTKVLTNLTGTFSAINGAKYKIEADATLAVTVANGYGTLGVVYKNGGAAIATDTLAGSKTTRLDTVGAVYGLHVVGTFTATATATYGIAVIGWDALGTATVNLDGDASYAINRLTVTRVA